METSADKRSAREKFLLRFRRNANALALRYGAPVWLVGGALRDDDPRDWDVRIILSFEDLKRAYGEPFKRMISTRQGKTVIMRTQDTLFDFAEWEWLRGYDNVKVSRRMSHRMCAPVDFQIQTEQEASAWRRRQRIRLDSTPDWVLKAGVNR